jgi:hypothetical protein
MDERLSTHFAHLFIRDPIVIFQETLDEPAEGKADHFEVCATFPDFFTTSHKFSPGRLLGAVFMQPCASPAPPPYPCIPILHA